MRRVHVVVRGVVQGVGYRYFAQRGAAGRALSGWVRNRRDGSVEAELEGDAPAVDALVADLHRGPAGARVTELVVTELPLQGGGGFEVRPTH